MGDSVSERQFLAKLPPTAARLLRVAHDLSFARDLETVVVTARKAARELTGADGVSIVCAPATSATTPMKKRSRRCGRAGGFPSTRVSLAG
jgi:hypothetical protein